MKLVTYEDKVFLVDEGILEPKKDVFLFYGCIETKIDDFVLDLGTGTGFFAIMLANRVAKVYAIDIDERAIRNARKNVFINDVEDKVMVLQGDMFEPVGSMRFDLIVCTLPQMPTPEWKLKEKIVSIADDGGLTGRELIDRFVINVKDHLNASGRVYLFHFSFLDTNKTIEMFEEKGLRASVSATIEIPIGRLTSERIKHIKKLGYRLDYDAQMESYMTKINVVVAVRP
jgi:release factor glutamine methyltransferase